MPLSTNENLTNIISIASKKDFINFIDYLRNLNHATPKTIIDVYQNMTQNELIQSINQINSHTGNYVIDVTRQPHNAITFVPKGLSSKEISSIYKLKNFPHTPEMIKKFDKYAYTIHDVNLEHILKAQYQELTSFFNDMNESVFNEFTIMIHSMLLSGKSIDAPLYDSYNTPTNLNATNFEIIFAIYLISINTQ